MTRKKNTPFLTDGTRFFHVIDEQPKGFEGILFAVEDDKGNESVLSAAQVRSLDSVELDNLPNGVRETFGVERTQAEREDDCLLYAGSGIDLLTAAVVTADEEPSTPDDSLLCRISYTARVYTGNVLVALGTVLGLWITLRLYIITMGF